MVFLTCMAVIGLGIAFVGLSYHHHKRHVELSRHFGRATEHQPSSS
jgi:hypothetical protein